MAVAVICEFNPFHNGHAYLLRRIGELTAQPVLAVMSGSFTQRGEAAVCSKFERAEIALRGGADLVAELPAVCAVANAARFARGGVAAAESFDCVDTLAFGCETDDLGLLVSAAEAVYLPEVGERVALMMKDGEYYPRALQRAVSEVCGEETARVISSPNNILAVEYIRALKGSKIKPLPIKRVGAAHDSGVPEGDYASASFIRTLIRNGEDASRFMPEQAKAYTAEALPEQALLYRLRTMSTSELAALPEVGEGLENRIAEAARTCGSVEELLSAVKTKRYIRARLSRILVYALLGITEELQSKTPGYVRVLGMTERGAEMLHTCRFEVITSAAKAMRSDSPNRVFLEKDILSTDVAALSYKPPKPSGTDYLTKMIK